MRNSGQPHVRPSSDLQDDRQERRKSHSMFGFLKKKKEKDTKEGKERDSRDLKEKSAQREYRRDSWKERSTQV